MSRTGNRRYREDRARILARDDVCHLCGEPGADAVDHVIAVANGGTDHPANLAPVHHRVANSRGIKCNLEKGAKQFAPNIIRRSAGVRYPGG